MKTKLRNILSGFLALCIVMSLVPLSAYAAGIVSVVNLTVAAPIAGNTPQATATLPKKASTQVLSVKWSPAHTVFEKNTDYTVIVELGIKPDQNKTFVSAEKMSVKVNGNKTKNVEKNGDNIIVRYTWDLAAGSTAAKNNETAPQGGTQTETKTEQKTSQTAQKTHFSDVKENAYYADAVKWAVDKKITSGTSSTTFSPEDTCTRAQILTFLWRAVGSPKGSGAAFGDVISNDYYYNAALWSKEKNMVGGSNFEPNTPCTRAYTVIYLWKNAGSPQTAVSDKFSDVDKNADYAQAVAWAVKNGITSGTSATTFSPNDTCTRGQIVTFLNRALASLNKTESAKTETGDDKNQQTDKKNESEITKPSETTDPTKTTDSAKKDETAKTDETTKKDETTKTGESSKTTETTKPSGKTESTGTKPPEKEINNENNWKKPGVFSAYRPEYDKTVYETAVKKALREALGSNMGANMTDMQKALALHEWLVLNCEYDETLKRKYAYSEYGAIVEGFAVCQGYTIAYNDLLSRVGIEAEFVSGWLETSADNRGPHGWSRVTINGKKYFVDVTADDMTPNTKGRVTHGFFMVSDKALYFHSQYKVHCTDTTYDNCLLQDIETPLFWSEKDRKFFYIDTYEVKMTSDFTEKITPKKNRNDFTADCAVMTDDQKYIAYFKPSGYTSEYPLYLYSVETGDYYTHKVTGIKNAVFCGMRLDGYNVEVVKEYYKNSAPYMTKVVETAAIPKNAKKRSITFDLNYSGGKVSNCEYISSYWTNGDGSFDAPKRNGYVFGGWYTEKTGGEKIESFDDVKSDSLTLYARWWGSWNMTEKPTLTETGKAVRELEGYPDIKEEKTIPVLTDTSVWKKTMNFEATEEHSGVQEYTSEYGKVRIMQEKKEKTYKYGIVYKNKKVYITVIDEGEYNVGFEAVENGETVSSAVIKVITNGAGESVVVYPKRFKPSGTVKATLYDSDMKELSSVEYEVK